MKRRLGVLFSICFSLLFLGCNGEYEKELCNGYRLVRMNSSEVRAVEPPSGSGKGLIVVNGNIEKYAVRTPLIIGFATANHMPADTHSLEGYFWINTQTLEVKEAMSESDWKADLERMSLSNTELVPVP